MVDSNNEPKFVDIAIPSNTSSTKRGPGLLPVPGKSTNSFPALSRSIDLVIQKLCESIKKGKATSILFGSSVSAEAADLLNRFEFSKTHMQCFGQTLYDAAQPGDREAAALWNC